jgi:hypothetical protein
MDRLRVLVYITNTTIMETEIKIFISFIIDNTDNTIESLIITDRLYFIEILEMIKRNMFTIVKLIIVLIFPKLVIL